MIFRLNTSVRPWAHRLVGLCVIAALIAGIFPLPLASSRNLSKDTSRPFPCQHHRCGCRSADQCWKKCCCFTNRQKLAWAKKHGVTPPAYVIAAAKSEPSTTAAVARACCKTSRPTCGSATSTHRHRSGGHSGVCEHTTKKATPSAEKDDAENTQYVINVLAQQCRGESSFWHSLPWSILPPSFEMSASDEIVVDELAITSDVHRGGSLRPPVPPPRIV